MQDLRGHPFRADDYKISGIGCDGFPDETKETLRTLAFARDRARDLSRLHGDVVAYAKRTGKGKNKGK
jgi:hypothetical protein